MKRPTIALCTAATLLTLPVLAQEDMPAGPPTPPKELEKFSRMIGYWQGEGTSRMDPSQPMQKWTSTSHVRKVLDGHFLREDLRIDSDAWETPLQFITFYGYDQQKKRFVSAGVSNMGKAELSEITFQDEDTMVSACAGLCDGKRVVERWVNKLGDDEITYLGNMAFNDGEWFVHVKGTARKIDGNPKAKIVDASHAFMGKASNEMGRLKNWVGKLRFKGELCMMPGMPMMPISGESITEPIFAGTVLQTVIHGDPSNGHTYEGWWAIAWDPDEKNYSSIGVNNVGEIAIEKGVWTSNKEAVFTCSRPWFDGTPSVSSGVMKCADDGTPQSYTCHSIIGTHKPLKSFHIDYSKK